MNLGELWLNLVQEHASVDSVDKAEAVSVRLVPREDPNELLLTEEDRLFLSRSGIRP